MTEKSRLPEDFDERKNKHSQTLILYFPIMEGFTYI